MVLRVKGQDPSQVLEFDLCNCYLLAAIYNYLVNFKLLEFIGCNWSKELWFSAQILVFILHFDNKVKVTDGSSLYNIYALLPSV